MPSHAAEYEIVITAQPAEGTEPPTEGKAVRRERVSATGETGASGYPRYSGGGILADIDPATASVEALTVDGAELPYGWTATVDTGAADSPGSAG